MAVTHADLVPTPKTSDLGSKTGAFLMVFTILLGLFCFILCLVAEVTRSELTWEGKGTKSECIYSGSGKLPLLSAAAAFFSLAMAMVVQHLYLLTAVTKSDSLLEISLEQESLTAKSLTWQAGFFFLATWICFAVGEILLLIGLSVESGHLKKWSTPRSSCLVIPQGPFTAAGVFGLLTVCLASGLYVTLLRAETHFKELENMRRAILEASIMYASPPTSPGRSHNSIRAVPSENPLPRLHDHYLTAFDKHSSLV